MIVNFLDGDNSDEIEFSELADAMKETRHLKRKYRDKHNKKDWVQRFLGEIPENEEDPIFPKSLLKRHDFVALFSR